ncbi:MAG: STAS/SEC14 domain-containing protein [Spirochaetales bacterium]|nr:STAS/SEC14 domain-containing protein [Spirochaetales bacterium]
MPIDISLDIENDIITRTVRGLVSTEELVKSIETVLNHPDFHPGMKSLTDLSQATHHTDSEDIQKIAMLISQNIKKIKGGKAAAVVSKKISFGMMRMLQNYTSGIPFEIEIFYNIEEAKKWLGIQS